MRQGSQKIGLQKRIDMVIVLNEQAEKHKKQSKRAQACSKKIFCKTAVDMEVDSILHELEWPHRRQKKRLHEIKVARAKRLRTVETEFLGLRNSACGAWSPEARVPVTLYRPTGT